MARTKPIHIPQMDPSDMPFLNPEIYQAMGEAGIFRMLSNFYQRLEASPIRDMFGEDMQESSRRSAAFYVQLLGGPRMYNNQYGNPMMRRRHFPFEIDEASRVVWRDCFYKTLDNAEIDFGFPAEHLEAFKEFIERFSLWMVNTETRELT
jgi:hemoglobin